MVPGRKVAAFTPLRVLSAAAAFPYVGRTTSDGPSDDSNPRGALEASL